MFHVLQVFFYVRRIIYPDRLKRKVDWHTFVFYLNTYEKQKEDGEKIKNESSRETDIGKRLGTEDHFFFA